MKQAGSDVVPFAVERTGLRRPTRLPVPIARVPEVAFDAMEIGMDPGGVRAGLVHDQLVRPVPIALGGPPQGRERRCKAGGRRFSRQAAFELVEGHVRLAWATPSGSPTTISPA